MLLTLYYDGQALGQVQFGPPDEGGLQMGTLRPNATYHAMRPRLQRAARDLTELKGVSPEDVRARILPTQARLAGDGLMLRADAGEPVPVSFLQVADVFPLDTEPEFLEMLGIQIDRAAPPGLGFARVGRVRHHDGGLPSIRRFSVKSRLAEWMAVSVLALAACGDDPVAPSPELGAYTLTSFNGAALPADVDFRDGLDFGTFTSVTGGELVLGPGQAYTVRLHLLWLGDGGVSPTPVTFSSLPPYSGVQAFSVSGNSITLTNGGQTVATGTFTGSTITLNLVHPVATAVFQREGMILLSSGPAR